MSQYESEIALAHGWTAFDHVQEEEEEQERRGYDTPRDRSRETQELAFLGSVGILVENFAKNLDDFIGHALDEWVTPPRVAPGVVQETRTEHAEDKVPTTSCEKVRVKDDSKVVAWSWNDSFSDEDDETGLIGTQVMSSPRGVFDILHERREHVRCVLEKKPLDRYKKHNAWLKSKILCLEKQIAAMEEEDRVKECMPSSLDDEHVTLQMQIEQLLSQKSKLVYENDSLKRENARLNELLEYFFVSTSVTDQDEDGGPCPPAGTHDIGQDG